MRTIAIAMATAYVVLVGGLAFAGVTSGTPGPLLWAALVALPVGAVALPAYYVDYGLLAQLPGHETPTGELEPWFAATTGALVIVLLVAAAVANLVLVWWFVRVRSRTGSAERRTAVPAR